MSYTARSWRKGFSLSSSAVWADTTETTVNGGTGESWYFQIVSPVNPSGKFRITVTAMAISELAGDTLILYKNGVEIHDFGTVHDAYTVYSYDVEDTNLQQGDIFRLVLWITVGGGGRHGHMKDRYLYLYEGSMRVYQ